MSPVSPGDAVVAVVVADIEYWFAKHTLELLRQLTERRGVEVAVVANKADVLNASEIRRVRQRAAQRMGEFGIKRTPPFFALSAKLELARRVGAQEAREDVRPAVRELCDAAFDAFRVFLYEFEAQHAHGDPAQEFTLSQEWAAALLGHQKEALR